MFRRKLRSLKLSFYRTYEGLKQYTRFFLSQTLSCFYRTYEGLKPKYGFCL